jgi:hypothetical protein
MVLLDCISVGWARQLAVLTCLQGSTTLPAPPTLLAHLPNSQAQSMTPKQLQEGLVTSIKHMKRSRPRKLYTAGLKTYRWGALGYSAFQM